MTVSRTKSLFKIGGKYVWQVPTFVKLSTHKLPIGKTIRRKAGTQIVDRAWHLSQAATVGSTVARTDPGHPVWALEAQRGYKDHLNPVLVLYSLDIYLSIVLTQTGMRQQAKIVDLWGQHIHIYIYTYINSASLPGHRELLH